MAKGVARSTLMYLQNKVPDIKLVKDADPVEQLFTILTTSLSELAGNYDIECRLRDSSNVVESIQFTSKGKIG